MRSIVPRTADKLVRELAVSVLADNISQADKALNKLETEDIRDVSKTSKKSSLIAIATEARLSMDSTGTGFHDKAQTLLARNDLGIVQRRRLEKELSDGPLSRASRQLGNSRKRRAAGVANSVVGAIGRSLSSGSLLPLRIVQALVGISVREHQRPDLNSEERDALTQWKRFIELNPDDPRALDLLEKIENAQWNWYTMQKKKNFLLAKRALEKNHPSVAFALAERTLRYAPEDENASRLLEISKQRIQKAKHDRSRSLLANPNVNFSALKDTRQLIISLLTNDNIEASAEILKATHPHLIDEAAFSIGIELSEKGEKAQMWELFERLGKDPGIDSNMSRHARNALDRPSQNPYGAFRVALDKQRSDQVRWLLLGDFTSRVKSRDLPKPLEWAIGISSLPGIVSNLPSRIIRFPWVRPKRRSPAVFARKYLARNPKGSQSKELIKWLEKFEVKRGNFLGAFRFAKRRDAGEGHLAKLKEKAGQQAFEGATKQKDGIARRALLEQVANRFSDTVAGKNARDVLGNEITTLTPQYIRMSKSFLLEHPEVTGRSGLGLKESILDGDLSNAELHPNGIAIVSGKTIEISYLAKSGKDREEPILRRENVSLERMSRLIAMLDESSMKQALVDPDVPVEYDAKRDVFFEHLRLGVRPPESDPKSESTYVFQGVNERYGMVRARKSILPVELVLQGSTRDLGFGAYPRFKVPKREPDQILYR